MRSWNNSKPKIQKFQDNFPLFTLETNSNIDTLFPSKAKEKRVIEELYGEDETNYKTGNSFTVMTNIGHDSYGAFVSTTTYSEVTEILMIGAKATLQNDTNKFGIECNRDKRIRANLVLAKNFIDNRNQLRDTVILEPKFTPDEKTKQDEKTTLNLIPKNVYDYWIGLGFLISYETNQKFTMKPQLMDAKRKISDIPESEVNTDHKIVRKHNLTQPIEMSAKTASFLDALLSKLNDDFVKCKPINGRRRRRRRK